MVQRSVKGVGVIGKMEPDPSIQTFRLVKEITDDEFTRYENAMSAVQRVVGSRQLQLVERNRTRVASVTSFYRNAIALKQHSKHFDPKSSMDNLAFEVLNWLTATRLFLDHHLTIFARTYGEGSDEHGRLKKAISAEYDASTAYRVLYKEAYSGAACRNRIVTNF